MHLWVPNAFHVSWKHCSSQHKTVSAECSSITWCCMTWWHWTQLHAGLWINLQSFHYSQILSCCQVSHGSQTQLCDPCIWDITHSVSSWILGGWEHLGVTPAYGSWPTVWAAGLGGWEHLGGVWFSFGRISALSPLNIDLQSGATWCSTGWMDSSHIYFSVHMLVTIAILPYYVVW